MRFPKEKYYCEKEPSAYDRVSRNFSFEEG